MSELTGMVGFAAPVVGKPLSRRRNLYIELIATTALAVSLIVAATAVSIGVARAHTLGAIRESEGAPIAVALCLGAAAAGVAGLTALRSRAPNPGAAGPSGNTDCSAPDSPNRG